MVLVISNNLSPYYEPYEFRHTCHLKCEQSDDIDALDFDDEHVDLDGESRRCTAVPFVGSKDFQTDIVARTFASIVKEVSQFWYSRFSSNSYLFSCEIDGICLPLAVCTYTTSLCHVK